MTVTDATGANGTATFSFTVTKPLPCQTGAGNLTERLSGAREEERRNRPGQPGHERRHGEHRYLGGQHHDPLRGRGQRGADRADGSGLREQFNSASLDELRFPFGWNVFCLRTDAG